MVNANTRFTVMTNSSPTEIINGRLNAMPGLRIVLDIYSKKKYNKDFTRLVVEDLKCAYEVLIDVLKSNETVELILRYILKAFVDDEEINSIILKVKKGENIGVKDLLKQTAK